MNILITLPKHLIDKIISGEKKFEMRKCLPKNMRLGEDGFFVVEKGTNEVRCWCRVDKCLKGYMTELSAIQYAHELVYHLSLSLTMLLLALRCIYGRLEK